uniref:Uncharacterized protein n=1 Tax=Rhizophagus irregularis (strain DAOM 181602 / DAOM 197198 / MUCL 43194) TaxID=747089 RepID=U9TAN9_RHIID
MEKEGIYKEIEKISEIVIDDNDNRRRININRYLEELRKIRPKIKDWKIY